MGNATAMHDFIKSSVQWLNFFELEYEGHLEGKLNSVMEDNAEEDFWLHDNKGPAPLVGDGLVEFFSAYKLLRFQLSSSMQITSLRARA